MTARVSPAFVEIASRFHYKEPNQLRSECEPSSTDERNVKIEGGRGQVPHLFFSKTLSRLILVEYQTLILYILMMSFLISTDLFII